MRTVCTLVAGLAITIGCGDSGSSTTSAGGNPAGPGGAGGAGASSSDGGNGATSPSGGNGGGGMPPGCQGVLTPADACASCVEANCCPELDACVNDSNCNGCLNGEEDETGTLVVSSGQGCDIDDLVDAVEACTASACGSECTPPNECNPVTNEGCDPDAGEVCDLYEAFVCSPPPNDVALCGTCDSASGPQCASGTTCVPETNQCGRYCCDDMDCGSGTCAFELLRVPNVGICVQTGTSTPACDAPVFSPSDGMCFVF